MGMEIELVITKRETVCEVTALTVLAEGGALRVLRMDVAEKRFCTQEWKKQNEKAALQNK